MNERWLYYMHKLIVPTGYMGSGSSALTDLISEFEGYAADNGSFEYVFLHCPEGLFDLEDKLLLGNNALRSDEAIHSFEKRMMQLYKSKLWWVGNYKQHVGEEFWRYTEEFINSIVQFKSDSYWYMQETVNVMRFFKLAFRWMIRFLTRGKIELQKPLEYKKMYLSFVSDEEFYDCARKYVNNFLKCMGIDEKNVILDQLLLPHNMFRVEKYFDERLECFVVQRDPRDVFILNKYIWKYIGELVPFPTDVNTFCNYYISLRATERAYTSSHIHEIWFEDLIYKYDAMVEQIMQILNLKECDHINRKCNFNPEISINNTQLFRKKEYEKEVRIIEEKLQKYLYPFPYSFEVDLKRSF